MPGIEDLSPEEILGQPFPLFELVGKDGSVAFAFQGIHSEHIDELVHFSLTDELIAEETPRDPDERFITRQSAISYLSSRPHYTLVSENGGFAGLIWFGAQEWHTDVAESPNYTFAIRIYGDARGNGYAPEFVNQALLYFIFDKDPNGVWLEYNTDNTAARHLYDKTHWVEIDQRQTRDSRGRLKDRTIMQLDIEIGMRSYRMSEQIPVYRKES
ncbi:MAG: GNAT family N-acetyltransferase [Candidatus Saccharimonadales bacterium]|nr:GNAT family N-acetyltransferase [Candidatus Saccharimonadales bacterium]